MSRPALLLTVLGAIALVVLSFLFLIKPKMDDVSELEAEAERIRGQQTQVEGQIRALEEVRANSPNLEAELAAMSAVIPSEPALPAVLRQLQMAADEAGVTLETVSPGSPARLETEDQPELSAIAMSLSLQGGYFQVVDFLRRLEDPVVTARGFLVQDVSIAPDEYPTLSVSVAGQVFSVLEDAPEPPPEEDAEVDGEDDDDEVDVDVDVTMTEEDAA